MVTIHIGTEKYTFPTSWEEVNISEIIDCPSPMHLVEKLGSVPRETLEKMSDSQMFALYKIIGFVDDPESLELLIEPVTCVEIESLSWEKFEIARKSITPELYKTLYHLCKIYYPDENKTVPIFSLGFNILNQINVFLSHYSEMFEDPPDPLEVEAGSEELSRFGAFATCYSLANDDILKMESIFKLPAIDVYNTLFFSWKKNKFQKRLMELRTKKE